MRWRWKSVVESLLVRLLFGRVLINSSPLVVIPEGVCDSLIRNAIHVTADRVEMLVRRDLRWWF